MPRRGESHCAPPQGNAAERSRHTTHEYVPPPPGSKPWAIRVRCGCCSCPSSGSASPTTACARAGALRGRRSSSRTCPGEAYASSRPTAATSPGVCHGRPRRHDRRPLSRLPALDHARRRVDGGRPVHAADAGAALVPGRPCGGGRRQRPVQAEHLDHGRQAVFAQRRAPRFAASPSSTWASTPARSWPRSSAARSSAPKLRLQVRLPRRQPGHDPGHRRVPVPQGHARPYRPAAGGARRSRFDHGGRSSVRSRWCR